MRNVLLEMHVRSPLGRWAMRIVVAAAIAALIALVPSRMFVRDPRAPKLEMQLGKLEQQELELRQHNAMLAREVEALSHDVAAVESRAREDLGMVYPGELVLRVQPAVDAATGGVTR